MIHTVDNNHQSTHINRQQPSSPPEITFNFTTTQQTLIISATNTLTTNEYIYEMLSHPNIDFNQIKQALKNNHYNTLINTAQCLQLKIGLIKIELVSKTVSQIKRLKQRVEKLQNKQSQLLFVISCQGVKIDEHENTIAEMKAALHTLRIQFDNKNEKEQQQQQEDNNDNERDQLQDKEQDVKTMIKRVINNNNNHQNDNNNENNKHTDKNNKHTDKNNKYTDKNQTQQNTQPNRQEMLIVTDDVNNKIEHFS